MDNIQKVSHTVSNNRSTSGHDVDTYVYEVVNPHWISALDLADEARLSKFDDWAWSHLGKHHTIVEPLKYKGGKYFITCIDL